MPGSWANRELILSAEKSIPPYHSIPHLAIILKKLHLLFALLHDISLNNPEHIRLQSSIPTLHAMQRLPSTITRYPCRDINAVPRRVHQARAYLPSLRATNTASLKSKPSRLSPPVRAFHSTRDFADYMKQVMSPMTGREGEQTPSEESNTLREIDRLFSIISSE